MRDKAYRRWQMEKRKARFRRILRRYWDGEEPTDKHVGIWYSTGGRPCACVFCRNPRKQVGELTLQELRAGWGRKRRGKLARIWMKGQEGWMYY